MGITFKENCFKLDAKDATYAFAIVDGGYLAHAYYGKKLPDSDFTALLRLDEDPLPPTKNERNKAFFMDMLPKEYPCFNIGDERESCLKILDYDGFCACDLRYVSHEIQKGKPKLAGLPATFGKEEDCETLIVTCKDTTLPLVVRLYYTVFEELAVIARHAEISNEGAAPIKLQRALSACVDFNASDYDMLSLRGAWGRERAVVRCPVTQGVHTVASKRGCSSHQDNPFLALLEKNATEEFGNVYGMSFVYSGNFYAAAEGCPYDSTRVVFGINPEDFSWVLAPKEQFVTPELILVYSDEGIGKMSRTFHDLFRNHLIRGKYKNQSRPILINNWEATYFDFDEKKLLSLAKEASKEGIEMLVMDDGWFSNRSSDNSSLGDWWVNEQKLKGGLAHLVEQVNKAGLKFGIWFEPEMISPDSDLYRAHPDWCIHAGNRPRTQSREQLVLDFSQKEIRDAIYAQIYAVLKSANIEYVKWDMNRQMTEVGSAFLGKEHQRELYHRYILGVYELQERLITDFPDILLENCAGGGGRFDAGMLYYSPQIWCSDTSDAIERLAIQQGTSLVYPASAMGAHVSKVPNEQVGRVTPMQTRGDVALLGTFGYELDLSKIEPTDRAMIRKQVCEYHKYNELVRTGDFYRIGDIFSDDRFQCFAVVAKDKSEALVVYVQVKGRLNNPSKNIKIKGLEQAAFYQDEATGKIYSGAMLQHGGINIKNVHRDFVSTKIHLIRT